MNTDRLSYRPWLYLLLSISVSAVSLSPLFSGGWFNSHDGVHHLERLVALAYEIRAGDYYPRWLSLACYGKGLPLFNYYSPGFYLVTSVFHLAGLSLVISVKLVCFTLTVAGFWGMFTWLRRYADDTGALIAATVYTFLPYHLLDMFVRGALPEFAALCLLPYLFYSIDRALYEKDILPSVSAVAVSSAAIMLTHNLTVIMIAPFAVLYILFKLVFGEATISGAARAAAGAVLGAGLSALYWLPLFMEISYLNDFRARVTTGTAHFSEHFLAVFQLFSSYWGFGYSNSGPEDSLGFQLGYVMTALSVLAAVCLAFVNRGKRLFGVSVLLLGLAGTVMTLEVSGPVYRLIGPLQYVQFPWRFLGTSTLFFAALTGMSTSCKQIAGRPWARVSLYATVVLLSIVFSVDQRVVQGRMCSIFSDREEKVVSQKFIGGMGAQNEYLPKTVPSEDIVPFDFYPVYPSATQKVENLVIKGSVMSFEIDNSGPASDAVVTWFYFPGWDLDIDGAKAGLWPSKEGFIQFNVPPGRHSVRLWFGTTGPRETGWAISIISLLLLAAIRIHAWLKGRTRT